MDKIAIIGLGFVGNAVYHTFDYPIAVYDPQKGYDIIMFEHCNFVLICLPTPTNKGIIDDSLIHGYLDTLKDYKGTIVIKSTMFNVPYWPNIVYNPEFLNQNNSVNDSINQKLIVLGGQAPAVNRVRKLYNMHSRIKNPEFFICTIQEAINIKYYHNIYNAYKALFWNYVNERCDHRMIARVYEVLGSNEMTNVAADGQKGYGGACFPKDVEAMNGEYPHELTEFMINYNTKLRCTSQ